MTTSPETVFIPITFDNYKNNKIRGLKAQLFLKKTLILLKQVEETKKLKEIYHKELKKVLDELLKELKRFEERLPTQKKKSFTTMSYDSPKTSRIDEELKEIQEKLLSLNV